MEDVKAGTRQGRRRWNTSFSPLEVGKQWFYRELRKRVPVVLKSGWETKQLRDQLGLVKLRNKRAEDFRAHCVDAWVLATSAVGGTIPDNTVVLLVSPVRLHRRKLHRLEPDQGGVRRPYGGTRSGGLKRGSLVTHPRWGVCYVGGTLGTRISLHRLSDGKRLTQQARPWDCTVLAFNTWKTRLLPGLPSGISAA